MGRKLNKISDERVRENLQEQLEWLTPRLAAPVPPGPATAQEKHLSTLGSIACEVGLMLYHQEKPPEEIRPYLARAAEFSLRALSLRGTPGPDEYRSLWEFEKAVNLTVCFGPAVGRAQAAVIPAWKYRAPEHPEHQPFADYLEALKAYLIGARPDDAAWQRLERHGLSDVASKEDRLFLLPKVQGLRAVATSEAATWNQALTALVKAHEAEAKRGELKLRFDGFICLPALMLAQLGRERGLSCDVRSPYLPLDLLGGVT